MPVKVVAIANRKGGVGKTTIAISFAEGLAALKRKRVLVVDLDGQYNASELLSGALPVGKRPHERKKTIVQVIEAVGKGQTPNVGHFITEDIVDMKPGATVSLLAGSDKSGEVERDHLAAEDNTFKKVQKIMDDVIECICEQEKDNYAVIIFDCPPGFSMITESALRRADAIVVPVTPTYLGSEGARSFIQFVRDKVKVVHAIDRSWVFVNMQSQSNVAEDFTSQIKLGAKPPQRDFKMFRSSYKYTVDFQRATDRRNQIMNKQISIWRSLFRRKPVSLFTLLWKPVTDEVGSAVTELCSILGIEEPKDESHRARTRGRSNSSREARV
ncbi:MAG: AAA family ATPase [Hyphomicrobium sp.]